jgi:hypothetical protein
MIALQGSMPCSCSWLIGRRMASFSFSAVIKISLYLVAKGNYCCNALTLLVPAQAGSEGALVDLDVVEA